MKKLFVTALAVGAALSTYAQSELTFRRFKVDIAGGYALQSKTAESRTGYVLAIEPKLALNDNITVGIRAEGETDNIDIRYSFLATSDFYFNTNEVRPFVGIGAGTFRSNASTGTEEYTSKFGFTPRAGVEFGHRRLALEYNIAGTNNGYNDNYLSIKLGFFLGGGRLQ